MKTNRIVVSFLVVLNLFFSACGGSPAEFTSSPDTTAPTFKSTNTASVNENQTLAITLVATDETSAVTYSISDTTNFSLNAQSGVVTFKTAPDYETKISYSFTATATDAALNEANQTITITVLDVDETVPDTTAPTFTSSPTINVHENQTTAITLKATDETSAVTYSISDTTNFSLNAQSGVVTFKTAPDYETKISYSFTATATDAALNEANQTITITILDVNETTSNSTIKKTGQTKSYDIDGNLKTNGSIKDDGYYQKGVTPNYTRASGIVTDELTALMWQDEYSEEMMVERKKWLTDANFETCSNDTSSPTCYDTSGDTAATYCTDLILGGYTDWRLPTSTELEGIVDYGKEYSAIDSTFQSNTSESDYWSSTTYEGDKGRAWGISLSYGQQDDLHKNANVAVRCVREGQ